MASFRAFGTDFAVLALADNMAKSLTLIIKQRSWNIQRNKFSKIQEFLE